MTRDRDRHQPAVPVGREREVARLGRLVRDPTPGRVVVISGEAGIGKTTVVDHVVAERLAAGDQVLRGSADERDTARFSLWRSVLRDLGVALPHADASVGAADQIDELAAVVGDALGTGTWHLVVLEDLHWADDASLAMVPLVGERLVGHPVPVVATVRTGEPWAGGLTRLMTQADPIVLGGVSPTDIASLAALVTGEVLGPDDASALHQMTGGNPLLVRELLAVEGDRLSVVAHGLLTRAIEQLGDEDADVLSAFALAGRTTPLAALARVRSVDVEQVDAALERGVLADILTADHDGRWFRHDLLAAAAAGRLGVGERTAAHRALAEFWATAPGGDDDGLEQARHWLAAVPSVPPDDAARAVMDIALALRRGRRAGDAADLLARALDALSAAPRGVLGPLWMSLGEARWDLAERPAALECFTRAAEIGDDADLVTVATIEVARQRYHNPFIPDPEARERLAELDARLGPADSVLRSALLGRRAMLSLQPPARHAEASTLADEAVAVARRLDDPGALLVALCDRAFVVGSVEDLRRRGPLAEEILDLARAAGRPDLSVAGYEWRFDDRLLHGDLRAAREALDEFEALAVVAPSPSWRCSALLRRAALLLAEGDRVSALEAIETASELAPGLMDPFEQMGLEMGIRAPATILHGLLDSHIADLQARFRAAFDAVPSTFMQVRLALADLLLGERDVARRRAVRWLSQPSAAFEAPDALATLGVMAFLVDELQRPDLAPAVVAALEPFGGLICTEIPLPTDLLLGQLHLLTGDHHRAIALAQTALGQARALPSAVIEAHCLRVLGDAQRGAGDTRAAGAATAAAEAIAEREGLVLTPPWSRRAAVPTPPIDQDPAGPSRPPRAARLSRTGDVWTVVAGVETGALAHIVGITHIARLVQVPGVDIPATELTGMSAAPMRDLGAALDAQAKRQYRQRINELQSEIDEAERWSDPERAERSRGELDALVRELRRAVGLGGRDRPQGSSAERARINAVRNIRRAVGAIATVAPELAAHLAVSIRTGHRCRYAPDPAARIQWEIDPG